MATLYSPKVETNGLQVALDIYNNKSYPGSGTTWNDLVTQTQFVGENYSWANNITQITIMVFLEKTGTSTGYASHPVNKWNGGTGNASFVLYHFGNFQGNGDDGNFGWYYTTSNNGWVGQYVTKLTVGQKICTTFQYNSTTGGQIWLNNNKVGGRAHSGTLGVNGSSGVGISGPTSDALTRIHSILFYNRELSDIEILNNYNMMRTKIGI